MPICPRCGKCLSSEQALTYHLNRKYKCGTWNCVKCGVNFNTKFQLQMHEMQCIGNRETHAYPTTDVLLQIFQTMPVLCIGFDEKRKVTFVSPQCEHVLRTNPSSFIGLDQDTCIQRIKLMNGSFTWDVTKDRHLLYVINKHN